MTVSLQKEVKEFLSIHYLLEESLTTAIKFQNMKIKYNTVFHEQIMKGIKNKSEK